MADSEYRTIHIAALLTKIEHNLEVTFTMAHEQRPFFS